VRLYIPSTDSDMFLCVVVKVYIKH